ncbi:MAG: sulfatase-like hydrolase/transferase [Chitinophaga sp.]
MPLRLLPVFILLTAFQANAQQKRYNVLVLLTDDQRFSTVHALGNEEIHTPNMDALVKSGTAFTQAHIMGSLGGAVCAPSRAMLMTSRPVFSVHRDGGRIPAEEKTFPEVFREQGYQTFATGKWHSDHASFNRSFSTGDNIFFGGMHTVQAGGHKQPKLHHYNTEGQYKNAFSADCFSSVCYADAAIAFLQQRQAQPFLMYVSFTAPHDPRTPPEEYLALYDTSKISLPGNFLPRHPFDNGELQVRDEKLLPSPRDPGSVKMEIAKYYAMISEADHEIGRVLKALRESGEYENTIIVFAADNGLAVGQHGLLGKQNLYDHSMRVPLVFCGPGIPAGKKVDAYCYLNDLFPTLCNMTGLPVPATVSGISLSDAFAQPDFRGRETLFTTYSNLHRAIVKDSMKLVLYNVNGNHPVQLFDLVKDPLEKNNLADNKKYRKKMTALRKSLYAAMREYGDFCDPQKENWGYPGRLKWEDALRINP